MKLGLQLYSVRDAYYEDPIRTLELVSEAGYHNLEGINFRINESPSLVPGMSADQLRAKLESLNLRFVSAHIDPILPFNPELLEPALQFNHDVGNETIGLSESCYVSVQDLFETCAVYNRIGELCKKYGLQFALHNHYHEFRVFEGQSKTSFELVCENTDPELVKFQLDTYWALRAGQDPVKLIERYGDRIASLHQKDYPKGYEENLVLLHKVDWARADANRSLDPIYELCADEEFTEIGDGIMDIQSILDAGNRFENIKYVILEQDHSQLGEFESIRRSKANFAAMKGVEA